MPKRSVEHFDDDVIDKARLLQTELLHQMDRREAAESEALDLELEQNSHQAHILASRQDIAREERAIYLTVLHGLARAQGYNTKTPLESERYAKLVFSATVHSCAFVLRKAELARLTHLTCDIVRCKAGDLYFDPISQRTYVSSGAIVMCRYSGATHYCPPAQHCDKTATAPALSPTTVAESVLHEVVVHRLFAVNELACEANWPIDELTEVDSMYSGLLFGRIQSTHVCRLNLAAVSPSQCRIFHIPHGWNHVDPFHPGAHMFSSGTLEICMEAGHMRLNLLGERLIYAKTPTALRDQVMRHFRSDYRPRDNGYVCLLTSQFKSSIIDQTPTTGKDEKVSLDRLSRWQKAQHEIEDSHMHDDDSAARDSVYDDLEREALAERAAMDPLKVAKQYGKEMENEENNRMRKEKDEEGDEEGGNARARSGTVAALERAAMPPPAHVPTSRLGSQPRKSNAALVAEGPGADEINGRRARIIAVLVSSNNSRALLYGDLLKVAAKRGHERLSQVQRQSRYAALPLLEQHRIWLATVVKEMPLPKPVELPDLPLERYIAVILRCWNFIVQTPFVTESQSNKRTQLTFTKMVISSLYFMAEGGYEVNCGFGESEQREMEAAIRMLPEGSRQNLSHSVKIYPNGKLLVPYMVDKAFLTRLSGLLNAKIRFDDGIIGRGRELLDSCYNSLICVKKRQVINELKLCPSSKEVGACLYSYFQYCKSLSCWESTAAPTARS
jgi:hypothetical protein